MRNTTHRKARIVRRGREERQHRTNPVAYCLKLGFFAGLLWGTLRWVLYTIHFTKTIPAFLIDPYFRLAYLKTGGGHVLGICSFIVFSIVAAFIYYYVLGHIGGPWPGLLYGAFWWCVWFLFLGPLLGMMEPVYKIGYNTLSTELCVFLMWGLFIGYTIAFEFNDEASREPFRPFE